MMKNIITCLLRLRAFVWFLLVAPFSLMAAQSPPEISLINNTMLVRVTDFATHHFAPSQDWIYEARIVCASVSPFHEEPIPITVEVSIIPDNPNIKTQTEEGTCKNASSFTMDKVLLTGDEAYTFKITYKSFEGNPIPPPQLLIVVSSLIPKMEPAKIDTGFFKNGAFIGPAKWTYLNGAYHEMTTGESEAALGSTLFTQHDTTGNGTPQSTIGQRFIAPYTGIYRLQFACQSVKDNVHVYNAQYLATFIAVNEASILPAPYTGSCAPQWNTVSHDILLLAGHAFDFSLEFDSVLIGPGWVDLRVDNLTLSYVGPADDLNTGIIHNGEFIGSHGWNSKHWDTVGIALNLGLTPGRLGSVKFKNPDTSIEQIIVPTMTDIYQLTFTCYTPSMRNSVTPKVVITTEDHIEPIVVTENCVNAPKQITAKMLLLLGKAYKLELIFGGRSAARMNLVVDDLALVPTHTLAASDTGLIKNGGFVGEHAWTYLNTARQNSARGQDDTQLGAGVLNITGDRIYQVVQPFQSGAHNFSFACQGNKARGSGYQYHLVNESNNQIIGSGSGSCQGIGMPWSVFTFQHTLIADNTYRVEFIAAPYTAYAIDNVKLSPTHMDY